MIDWQLDANERLFETFQASVGNRIVTMAVTSHHIRTHRAFGLFGNKSELLVYPLQYVVMDNGVPLVSVHNTTALVQLRQAQLQCEFASHACAKRFAELVASSVAGHPVQVKVSNNFTDFAQQAGAVVKDLYGGFMEGLGIGRKEEVTGNCEGCLAPLHGTKGQTVLCDYCDRRQTL